MYFRENPTLLQFKKPNYIDPDILAVRRAGKSVPINKLIKDSDGFEFGCKLKGLFHVSSNNNLFVHL